MRFIKIWSFHSAFLWCFQTWIGIRWWNNNSNPQNKKKKYAPLDNSSRKMSFGLVCYFLPSAPAGSSNEPEPTGPTTKSLCTLKCFTFSDFFPPCTLDVGRKASRASSCKWKLLNNCVIVPIHFGCFVSSPLTVSESRRGCALWSGSWIHNEGRNFSPFLCPVCAQEDIPFRAGVRLTDAALHDLWIIKYFKLSISTVLMFCGVQMLYEAREWGQPRSLQNRC